MQPIKSAFFLHMHPLRENTHHSIQLPKSIPKLGFAKQVPNNKNKNHTCGVLKWIGAVGAFASASTKTLGSDGGVEDAKKRTGSPEEYRDP